MNRRMAKEYKDLTEVSPLEGCRVEQSNEDQFIWTAFIEGPAETPYTGGTFKLQIKFAENYPFAQPDFKFLTKIYHPNINDNGELCKDMIQKDQWVPTKQIRGVLDIIISILKEPSTETPLNVEAGTLYNGNRDQFNKQAAQQTQTYAQEK